MAKKPENKKAQAADQNEPANISAGGELEASGAILEDAAKEKVDLGHPAVDDNPREGTTVRMNQIDFNDPTLSDLEAVEKNLKNQG